MRFPANGTYSSPTGLSTNEIPNENQKLLHSWQSIGTLTYGILATKFLKGRATSVSDQA